MTIEEKNNELAFFDDWQLHWQNKGGGELFNVKPSGHCWSVWTPPQKWWNTPIGQAAILSSDFNYRPPNYFKDLNAVHELEKIVELILDSEAWKLDHWINEVVCGDAGIDVDPNLAVSLIRKATAEQRCEAIGKTLNLW